jgi:hypothetical protein
LSEKADDITPFDGNKKKMEIKYAKKKKKNRGEMMAKDNEKK